MAQVSYGTITITDTTDLTTYIRYATKAPLTAASQFQETPTTNTRYIAVLSIPASDPIPAWNSSSWKWLEFIGTDGVSVLGTREIYYLKTNSTTVAAPANGSDISQASANVENQWTKSVPTYVTNGEYWTCIQTHLDGSPTWVYGSPVLNQSLTDMNHDIDVMKSITQQSVEDSQGALGIARAMQQNFWWWGEDQTVDSSFTLPAGAYTSDIKKDAFKANPTGGYLVTRSDGVYLNNGRYVLMGLTGNALKFYRPGTTKLLSGTETIDAQLDSNGLTLSKGGIKVIPSGGAIGDNNSVYISSDNLGSKVASLVNDNNKTNWRAVIGSKFGVDSEGNLYANEAHISGEITASKLTISSNATISDTNGLISNSAVEVGGRNLFGHGSDCSKSLDGMVNIGFSITTEDGFKCAHASGEMGAGGKYLQSRIPFTPKPNEVMAISAWVKIKNIVYGTGNPSPMCEFYTGGQTDPTDNKWYSYNTVASYLDGVRTNVQGLSHLFTNLITDTNWHKVDFILKWQNYAFTANLAPYVYLRNATGDLYVRNIKYERGNKATDWTPAPEDAIGEGTNLLYNSAVGKIGGQANKGWRASGGVVSHISLDTSPVAGVTGAVRVTNNGSSAAQIGIAQDGFTNRFIAGELYSQGAWIRGSGEFTCYLQPIWNEGNNTGHGNDFVITTDWQYYKTEGLKLLGTQQSTYSAGYFYAKNVPAGGWVEVCGMKLERGAKATDWTPAPEDVASDIDDASKVANSFLKFESGENGGLMVADLNGASNTTIHGIDTRNVLIDVDSVDIREGQHVLASFGAITTLGDKHGVHTDISPSSISFSDDTAVFGSISMANASFPFLEATSALFAATNFVIQQTPDGRLGVYKR